jgi:hypothetical protein
MIVQENIKVVVMLARFIEEGKSKVALYFPEELNDEMTWGKYKISNKMVDKNSEFIVRKVCKRNRKVLGKKQ